MARVEIPAPADVVQDAQGNALSGRSVTLKLAGTSTDVTHYSALSGGTSATGGLVTWTDGTVRDGSGNRRYIDSGAAVDMTVAGQTRQLEPLSASVETRVPAETVNQTAANVRDILTLRPDSTWGAAPPADVVLNSLNFPGLDPTGATSSATALDNAVAACIPATDPATTTRTATRRLHVPPGTFMRNDGTAVLDLRSVMGFNLRTGGPQSVRFRQEANADAIVKLNGASRCDFDGFTLETSSGIIADKGLWVYWDDTAPNNAARTTTGNRFGFVDLGSSTRCRIGIHLGQDSETNQVDSCWFGMVLCYGGGIRGSGTTTSGNSSITSVTGSFPNGTLLYGNGIPAGASVLSGGGTSTLVITTDGVNPANATSSNTARSLFGVEPGVWEEGVRVGHGPTGSGSSGNNFLHTFDYLSPGQYRRGLVCSRAGLTVTTFQPLSNECDVYIDGPPNGEFSILSGRSENSQRFLANGGAGTARARVTISDMLYNAQQMAADSAWFRYDFPGNLNCRNIEIVSPPSGLTPKFTVFPSSGRPTNVSVDGFMAEQADPGAFNFSGQVVADVRNYRETAAAAVVAGQVPTVASAATVSPPFGSNTFFVSGTADITALTVTGHAGRTIRMIFTGTAATNGVVDNGTTLNTAGNLAYTPNDALTLFCDGTNWIETGRSVN